MLGIKFACDGQDVEDNFLEIQEKIKKVVANWYNRTLPLFGKVLIVHTLIGSLLIYKMFIMSNLHDDQLATVYKLIKNYLWGEKHAKISMQTLMCDKHQGGLRLVNLKAKQNALKISWIPRIIEDEFLNKQVIEKLSKTLGNLMWLCNLSAKDVVKIYPEEDFWTQVLLAWSELNYSDEFTSKDMVMSQIIWQNSHVRLNDMPIIWKDWYEAGITYVCDIITDQGEFLSIESIQQKYQFTPNWLQWCQLQKILPDIWLFWMRDQEKGDYVTPFHRFSKCNWSLRTLYDTLIDNPTALVKYANRWILQPSFEDIHETFIMEEYQKAFTTLYQIAKPTKYRDFQYRFLLCKLVTNKDLFNWKISGTEKCTFCHESIETLRHLMLECEFVQPIWQEFIKHMKCRKPTFFNVLCNKLDNIGTKHVFLYILLLFKQYVYRCRCIIEQPNVTQFINELNLICKVELYNTKHHNRAFVLVYT